jgi:hypothetical protein
VRSDVISALVNEGYTKAAARQMATAVHDGDTFESGFRRVISRNPMELIIFGNPEKVYGRKSLLAMKRAGNPLPAALLSAFESAAGSKLFDSVTSGKSGKKNPMFFGRQMTQREARSYAREQGLPFAPWMITPAERKKQVARQKKWTAEVRNERREQKKKLGAERKQKVIEMPRRNSRKNPEGAGTERATQLFEKFHHRGAAGTFERQRSARQRKDYTILGPLVAIGINPEYFDKMEARAGKKQFADWAVEHYDQLPRLDFMTPGQVDQVKDILGDPDKYIKYCPLLASSPNGRQLYALAEDVQIDLSKFDTDAQKDYVDLGDATFVVYIAKKPHEVREWVHMMGEDGGTRPRLMYDRLRKEVCFIGGSYVVKAPGIMH